MRAYKNADIQSADSNSGMSADEFKGIHAEVDAKYKAWCKRRGISEESWKDAPFLTGKGRRIKKDDSDE